MIIVDYSGIAVAAAFSQKHPDQLDQGVVRHMILNSLRMHNQKNRDEFGQMVIACDSSSWRKEIFPEYKAARKKSREKSKLDWNNFFTMVNTVRDEIKENFPYPVVTVDRAEADDIIGILVSELQEFGRHEEILIVSGDKDFLQLQQFSNVKQYSPVQRKFLTCENPHRYLFEHICKGDASDGVPNVLSSDKTFTEELRQTPLRAKKIDEWWENRHSLQNHMDQEVWRNYQRNEWMINLRKTPPEIREEVINQVGEQSGKNNNKILNYLVTNRCGLLVESAQEFFTNK
jgi:predicted nuclease of predicted toxin-antitoxin system